MEEESASKQIDTIISKQVEWKAEILKQIRETILTADPCIVEEIKWRMKTRPEGLAVWSKDGIVCFAEIWKDNVKLLFAKGAFLKDSDKLFNARLESKDLRAIEFREDSAIDTAKLIQLITKAIQYNAIK